MRVMITVYLVDSGCEVMLETSMLETDSVMLELIPFQYH